MVEALMTRLHSSVWGQFLVSAKVDELDLGAVKHMRQAGACTCTIINAGTFYQASIAFLIQARVRVNEPLSSPAEKSPTC